MSEEEKQITEQPKPNRAPLLVSIDKRLENIAAACSDSVQATEIMASLEKAIAADSKIMNCTPTSVLSAMMACAKLGIDPSGEHNSGWFIRYGSELKLMIGYNGYIDLITRSGNYAMVSAEVVYEGEHYEVHAGTRNEITHTPDPSIRNKAGEHHIIGAYAVAFAYGHGGVHQFVTISKRDIEAARSASKAQTGPWKHRYPEMVKKTAVRSLSKWMVLDRVGQEAAAISDEGDGFDYRRSVANAADDKQAFGESIKGINQAPGRDTDEQDAPSADLEFVAEIGGAMDAQEGSE